MGNKVEKTEGLEVARLTFSSKLKHTGLIKQVIINIFSDPTASLRRTLHAGEIATMDENHFPIWLHGALYAGKMVLLIDLFNQ